MIRDKVKNSIFNSLNYAIFRIEDFNISEEYINNKYRIYIAYNNSYFNFSFSSESSYCETMYSPGAIFIKSKESINLEYFENEINLILHSWMNRIKDELLTPMEQRFINNELQNLKKQLDDSFLYCT